MGVRVVVRGGCRAWAGQEWLRGWGGGFPVGCCWVLLGKGWVRGLVLEV